MKVRLVSDGHTFGTKVLDEAGNEIKGITQVSFTHEAGGMPRAAVELAAIEVDVRGELVVYGPAGKRVAKIVYEDGSVEQYF